MNGPADSADLMITLVGEPGSVAVARRSVRSVLHGMAPGDVIENAEAVVEILALNAIRHGGLEYTVRAWVQPYARFVRLEVHDRGRTTSSPAAELAEDSADQGGGLLRVAELTTEMGHEIDADGTLLWAVIRWAPW